MATALSRTKQRTARTTMARREAINGYLFIAPAVLGFVLWVAGPMVFSAWLSLTEWDLLSPPEFVGLSNYRTMVQRSPLLEVAARHLLLHARLGTALSGAGASPSRC